MLSTTSNDRTADGNSQIKEGLRLAVEFVRGSRLPARATEELRIIAAISALQRGDFLSSNEADLRDQLYHAVESITNEAQVSQLIGWIRTGGFGWRRFLRGKRTCQRHMLLLLSLAKVVAPVSRFLVIPALANLGIYPNRETIGSFLNWIPSWYVWGTRLRLAISYLELTHELWIAGTDVEESGALDPDMKTFARWCWQRRLLVLISRRARRVTMQAVQNGDSPTNPVLASDTLEFDLALNRCFTPLRVAGGRVSARVLNNLGYRDSGCGLPSVPLVPIMLTAAIGLSTLWLLSESRATLIRRDEDNRRIVREVIDTLQRDASNRENSLAVPDDSAPAVMSD